MPVVERPLDLRRRVASTVTDTEEGRAFFQRRLSVFGFCLFTLAGGTWVTLSLTTLFVSFTQHDLFSLGSILHFSNAAVAGGLWFLTRSRPLPGRLLHALDIGTALSLTVIWALAGLALPDPIVGRFIALLSFIMGTLARAIVVPSTARRTSWLGAVSIVTIVAFAASRGEDGSVLGSSIATACWALSAVAIATLASHTIFGLRREVEKARVLGQYTLESKLGEGGMGAVWRASHALLRRPTAVKLLPQKSKGDSAIRRFEREVQLTASLTHPNTVAIYDYGRTRDGIFYYAMELLDGIDLERLVAEHGPQPPERVVHVLSQVCGALAEPHDLGLVHRDIKPANIILSPRTHEHEFAKVLDFGLVKRLETDGSAAPGTMTGSNVITGTPLYLSPEAIQFPDSVDARSDLYALGAVAWFLLVGRPVFEGPTVVAVCAHHLHTQPERPSEVLGSPVPGALEDVILACLEKDPAARPQGARDLRERLEATKLGSSWTRERADSWWKARQGRDESRAHPPSEAPRTIALELDQRGSNAE